MQHHLRAPLRQIVAALFLCATVIALAVTYHAGAQAGPSAGKHTPALTDIGPFEATVYAGPDKGMPVSGTLRPRATRAGALTGLLVRKGGAGIALSGQLTGYAINLVFYPGAGKHIFGVGTIGQDPGTKRWVLGGPLVGPGKGDSGAWDGLVTAPAGAIVLAIHTDASLTTSD
jgi:hypothetical protein